MIVSTLGCRVDGSEDELFGTYANIYGHRLRRLTDYRSRVCFSLCVYANVIVGSQLRLMYGPETNHQSIQIIRAYSNGEREPKGPETRKRNAQAGRFEWIEAAVLQPAERAIDYVVFLPGPEEILDVHQQIQTRSS